MRVILVLALLLSAQASAECGSDMECKGERICVDGGCVDPPQQPEVQPEPAPQPEAAPVRAAAVSIPAPAERYLVLAIYPATAAAVTILGHIAGVRAYALPVGVEYAVDPRFTLGATAAPIFVEANGRYTTGIALGIDARLFPGGTAPDGGWVAGGLAAGTGGGAGSFDVMVSGGWQWVFRSGFVLGLGGQVGLVSLATGAFPVGVVIPVGFAF